MSATGGGALALSIDDLVRRAQGLFDRSERRMLGITGPPGAGKSTLAAALAQRLADQLVVVPMDGFHLSNEVLEDLDRRNRKGAPDTFDVGGYVALLRRIRHREENVYAPRFDRHLEQSIGSAQLVPASTPLVVTEGNYLLSDAQGWPAVRELLDEIWYLDVDVAEIRRRLIERRVGHGHRAEAAESWVNEVDLPNAVIVTESRERADLTVRLTPTD